MADLAVSTPTIDGFFRRWEASGAAERANYSMFLNELCDLLDVPRPDPAGPDDEKNAYVFERAVPFPNPDGSTTTSAIASCSRRSRAVIGSKPPRSLSEYLLVLSHGRWISLGFGLFGLGPTLCAHYPPQSTPTLQERRQIFKTLWVKHISCHSADTFSRPRNRNLRIPRADLIMPNTGSTMCLRAA